MSGNLKCVVKHLKPKSLEPEVLDEAKKLFERKAETLYKLGNYSNQIQKIFGHFHEVKWFCLVQECIEGEKISRELTTNFNALQVKLKKIEISILCNYYQVECERRRNKEWPI